MDKAAEQIHKQLHESQAKYTYFLLAAAASGIAFAVQRTTGRQIHWSMLLLGLAVLSWAISFFAGCRNRQYFHSTLIANFNLILVENGEHPDFSPNTQIVAAVTEAINNAAKHNSTIGNKWALRQFRLLILGAVFFIAWHITEMCIK